MASVMNCQWWQVLEPAVSLFHPWLIDQTSNLREVSTLFRRHVGLSHKLRTQLGHVWSDEYSRLQRTLEMDGCNRLYYITYCNILKLCMFLASWKTLQILSWPRSGRAGKNLRSRGFLCDDCWCPGFSRVNSSKWQVVFLLLFGDAWNKVDWMNNEVYRLLGWTSWSNRLGDFTLGQGKAWLLQLHPSKQLVWWLACSCRWHWNWWWTTILMTSHHGCFSFLL